ncbi:Proteasome subunit alpha type-2-A [Linum perenne]
MARLHSAYFRPLLSCATCSPLIRKSSRRMRTSGRRWVTCAVFAVISPAYTTKNRSVVPDGDRKSENVDALVRGNLVVRRQSLLPRILSVTDGAAVCRKPFKPPCSSGYNDSSEKLFRRLRARRRFVPWGSSTPVVIPSSTRTSVPNLAEEEAEEETVALPPGIEPLVLSAAATGNKLTRNQIVEGRSPSLRTNLKQQYPPFFPLDKLQSPSGKLVQIEHALTAVGSGQTSLGIKAANGVVIATEKKLPSILVDEASVQKIQCLTPNIGVVYSGMGPDFRVLVRKSRKQAEQYHKLYKEQIPVTQLVRETAAVMQEFTQSGGVRPFGVSLLVAGFDDKGPQLYQVDPSGSYFSWKASAMGKNVSNAKTFLEKRYTEDMELDDAVHTAILTLKEGFEGQISAKNIEIGIIGADKKFRVLTPAEIDDYLAEVE